MSTFLQDLRFGIRQLRRTPGFAIIAVLTLALGIGANTAIFSVMNAVLLRSLPVQNPDRLVLLHYTDQPERSGQTGYDETSLPYQAFDVLRNDHRVFTDLMAFVPLSGSKLPLRFGNDLQDGEADEVSGNFFSGLGVAPVLGRTLNSDDERQHSSAAVLSFAYWDSRFSRDKEVLGQTLFVKGIPFTIVGVASPGFLGLERRNPTDVWVPLQTNPLLKPWGASVQDKNSLTGSPDWFYLMTIGRLAPGLSEKQAAAQITPIYQATVYSVLGNPGLKKKKSELYLTPARGIEGLNSDYKEPLKVLMMMVGLVLIIACANVAMLLIARNSARRHEFTVRIALGGSRARIFVQLLTESLLLVSSGAALGWLFANWATHSLAASSQIEVSLAPDRSVLLFTIALSLIAGLVFGLAPLGMAYAPAAGIAVKTNAISAQIDRKKAFTGKLVICAQMSMCLALLVGAGLLLRTLNNLGHANVGFKPDGLLVFATDPPATANSDQAVVHFYDTLLDRLRALPQVEAATVLENRIGAGWSDNTAVRVDGADPQPNKFSSVRWNSVGSDFFKTLQAHLVAGRDFTDSDTASAPKVAVVNQFFVDRYLHGRPALGHQIQLMGGHGEYHEPYTIVGVAQNMTYTAVKAKDVPMGWAPYTQATGEAHMNVELRTHGDPNSVLPDVRRIMRDIDPDVPILEPITQSEQLVQSYSDDRLFSHLATFFGGLAALLVAIGLYGTLAYRVHRRTAEIGVRMALGARRTQVLWMIMRESLVVAAIGVAVGLPLALAGARWLKSMLFGLSPADPLTFLLALIGIAALAVFSALMPARKASSVDPMVALRYE
jgi:predicted permease